MKYRVILGLFSLAALLAPAPRSVHAGIINGDFESPNLAANAPAYVQLTTGHLGWQEMEDLGPNSSTGIIRPNGFASEVLRPVGPNNFNVGFLQLANEWETAAALYQTIELHLQANTEYIVNFDVGNRQIPFNAMRDADTHFRAFFTFGDSGTTIPYIANGTMYHRTLAPGPAGDAFQVGYIPDGQWLFNQQIRISTIGMTPDQLNRGLNLIFRLDRPWMPGNPVLTRQVSEVFLDNVSVTSVNLAPIPEPSSLALMGIGAVSLLFYGRRRRRRAAAA